MLPTIDDAANAIRTGTLRCWSSWFLRCLHRVDCYEPRVRAWVLIDRAGACAEAERLEKAADRGEWRGPLHGIPLGIKDIIDVAGWPTVAGSRLWANNMAFRDAEVVTRLRQAGAILLGKTVTTPYASFDPPPTRVFVEPGTYAGRLSAAGRLPPSPAECASVRWDCKRAAP